MVVVRSMQLTQKKTTATFKQLDGVIRATKPDGSKTSYTHKCGELDKTVPIMIGAGILTAFGHLLLPLLQLPRLRGLRS